MAGVGEWFAPSFGSGLETDAAEAAPDGADRVPAQYSAPLDAAAEQELVKTLRKASLKASAALSVSGPALLYYVESGRHHPLLLLEAELTPDLGPHGLYTALWMHNGRSYPELARLLIERSLFSSI